MNIFLFVFAQILIFDEHLSFQCYFHLSLLYSLIFSVSAIVCWLITLVQICLQKNNNLFVLNYVFSLFARSNQQKKLWTISEKCHFSREFLQASKFDDFLNRLDPNLFIENRPKNDHIGWYEHFPLNNVSWQFSFFFAVRTCRCDMLSDFVVCEMIRQ